MRVKDVVTVIGGGLAGSECALQLAKRGITVRLYEQRPQATSPAHKTDKLAELVCSNSFKSEKLTTAAGQLKRELKTLDSELIKIAESVRVRAGGSLAVDRELFAQSVTDAIEEHPLIELIRESCDELPDGYAVIAAGPLCSDALFSALQEKLGAFALHFFDAAAPILDADSINLEKVFAQSRYADNDASTDYLNCPLTKDEYEHFVEELKAGKRTLLHDFDKGELFSACQPVEEVARQGNDALRFGALKPVGIIDPHTGARPWANIQLRAENEYRNSYNLVGFQTNLSFSEQERIFRQIPGLEQAEFLRFGVMHRNSFIDSPHVLEAGFKIPGTELRLAGQITGTEGYTEAIASGLYAALTTFASLRGLSDPQLPKTSALGSLVAYAQDPQTENYQPMHVQLGLFPNLPEQIKSKKLRREKLIERAQADMEAFVSKRNDLFL